MIFQTFRNPKEVTFSKHPTSYNYTSVTNKENGYFSRVGKSKVKPIGTNTRLTETEGQLMNKGHGRIPIIKVYHNPPHHIDLVKVKKDLRRQLQDMKILK